MAGRAKENLPGGSLKYLFVYLKIRIFKCSYRIYIYTYVYIYIPSGYLTVRHGKIHPFLKGKSSISVGHGFHGYVKYPEGVYIYILLESQAGQGLLKLRFK